MKVKNSITFGPGVNAIKFIFFLVTVKINKLECLSLPFRYCPKVDSKASGVTCNYMTNL